MVSLQQKDELKNTSTKQGRVTHWLKQETIKWITPVLVKPFCNMTGKHTHILRISEYIYFLNFFFSIYCILPLWMNSLHGLLLEEKVDKLYIKP